MYIETSSLFLLCLFVCFLSNSTFQSYGDLNIASERLNSVLYLAFMAIKPWGFFSEQNLHPEIWSSLKTRDTHTYCWPLGGGTVITCFNDLGLSRLGIETVSPACSTLFLLRHRGDFLISWIYFQQYWMYWQLDQSDRYLVIRYDF